MYGESGKLLECIKSTHANRLACFRVKGGEHKWLRIDRGILHTFDFSINIWMQ